MSIYDINGKAIDGKSEAWKLAPFSSFVIPVGDSFIEVKESFGGYNGYVRFYAENDQVYTISYKQEQHNGFRLTVTDSQQHQVVTHSFGGCDSITSYDNENSLLDAIAANDAKEVQRLLQAGANPNVLSRPAPLPLAALESNFEITQILIAAGICVNTVEGSYALNHAAKNGNLEIAQVLL
ncbi:MAG: ankyrin repeat domain-containing protein, partial [Mariprofundaceae bacterium]|nr:ankyrin repeat domain-containing protein [Mariprofundaceae bacterium]